jgi:beta-galactosidase
LAEPLRYSLWRAPIDNDIFTSREAPPFPMWQKHWLDRIYDRVDAVEYDDGSLVATGSLGGRNVPPAAKYRTTYRVFDDGTIDVEVRVSVGEQIPYLPRFGVELCFAEHFERARYYGLGPGQNYRDMRLSALLGLWDQPIDEMGMRYVKPQENGARGEVRHLTLTSEHCAVHVSPSDGRPLRFNVSRNTVKEVERARTYPELEPRVGTVLYLDYAQNGVGSAACGPTLPAEHRFSEKEFTFAFQIRFEESGGTT